MRLPFLSRLRRTAFICGCGHSGTTLLATIMSTHPQVYLPLRETATFLPDDERCVQRRLRRLKLRAKLSGRSVLVEKTPRHVRYIQRIRQHVPEARFIMMVRDGRDVAASIGKREAGDYQSGIDRWVRDNAFVRRELGKPEALLLRYEDLIEDTPGEVARVCDFVGVDYRPEMLEYHKRQHLWFGKREVRYSSGIGKEHEDLRNWQVNQPIFDGRGRWKQNLPATFVEQFAGGPAVELMQAFGYSTSLTPAARD